MTFDPDLMRELLLDVEGLTPEPGKIFSFNSGDKPQRDVDRHMQILIDEGYVEGELLTHENGVAQFHIIDLTLKGHQFLATARDKALWKKTVEAVKKSGAGITIQILSAMATKISMQQAGLGD
jgi:hypothetical protein